MRKFVTLLIVLVICLIGIGFYLGWFSFSRSNPAPEGSKVNVSVDKEKIKSDVSKAEEKVKEEVKKLEEKVEGKGAK